MRQESAGSGALEAQISVQSSRWEKVKLVHQILTRPWHYLTLHTSSYFYQVTLLILAKPSGTTILSFYSPKWHSNTIPTCTTSLQCTGTSPLFFCWIYSWAFCSGRKALAPPTPCPLGSHGLPSWTQCLWAAGRETFPQGWKVKGTRTHNIHYQTWMSLLGHSLLGESLNLDTMIVLQPPTPLLTLNLNPTRG